MDDWAQEWIEGLWFEGYTLSARLAPLRKLTDPALQVFADHAIISATVLRGSLYS